MPITATAEEGDSSRVIRVQDTDTWYEEATKAFMTKETYWFDQVTTQPEGYAENAEEKTVTIATPEALVWWAKQVNQGTSFGSYTVNITEDLDLSAHYWTPMCTGKYEEVDGKWAIVEAMVLEGTTINGNGHTINGLATATGLRGPNQGSQPGDGGNCYYDSAFIGYSCCNVTVENLTFAGAQMAITAPLDGVLSNGSSMVSVIVGGQNNGSLTLNNVTVDGANVLAMQKTSAFVGNLMGKATLTVNNCGISNSTFSAYFQVAPIAGYGVSSDQVEINGIQLKNNTIQMVDQTWAEYWVDENTSAQYYRNKETSTAPYYLNASTVAVFADVTNESQVEEMIMVAEVNGYSYPGLQEAIGSAQDGETVTLLSNVSVTEEIAIQDKGIILDLNGYVIQNAMDGVPTTKHDDIYMSRVFHVCDGAALTVNGTMPGSGMMIADEVSVPGIFAVDMGATLTLNGGSYTGNTSTYYANESYQNYYGNLIGIYDRKQDPKQSVVTLNDVTVSTNYAFLDTLDTIKENNSLTVNVFGGSYEGHNRFLFHVDSYPLCPVNFNGVTATMKGSFPVIELDGSAGTFEDCSFEVQSAHENNFSDSAIFVGYVGTATINSGTYTSAGTALYIGTTGGEIVVNGGVFSGEKYAMKADASVGNGSSITVTSGEIQGTIAVGNAGGTEKITVTGGYFTNDPSDYLVDGYVAGESDDSEYAYQVVAGGNTENPAEVVPAEPDIDVTGIEEGEELSQTLSNVEATLTAAANAQAARNAVTNEQATEALEENGINIKAEDTVTVVVQPYLDITVESYANNGEKELTLDITPMYRTIATTVDVENHPDAILVQGDEGVVSDANAVVISGQGGVLPVTRSVELSIPLPSGFVGSVSTPVYVQHKGYEYTATLKTTGEDSDPSFTATFTNPHGFSVFTLSTTSAAEAELNEIKYTSLTDAIAAAQNNDKIKLLKDGLTATMSGDTRTVILENGVSGTQITVTVNDQAYTISPTGSVSVSYTRPYIPPANPNYKITIGDMENGTVTANPTAAKAGATVTLTPVPDEGYALSTLTVTDRFGDAVRVTENADGTYTFTMPNGQVTVQATFVETQEPAPAMPFTDVKEGDWFYEEVLYAYENGLMNGVGDNRFAPNSATTRGMLVTILYRLEGEPAVTGEADFDDVGDTWYTDAVIWAAANDIVNGIGDNQFGPENTLTREQLVTMLYRYAQNKGYDVTASADLSGYPDAGKVQTYAQKAMSWAVAEGIVEGMDGNLNPAGNATRAQIATILMRFCEGVAK